MRLKGWPLLAVAAAFLLAYAVENGATRPEGDRTFAWVLVVASLIMLGAWLATELLTYGGRSKAPEPEPEPEPDDEEDADA